MHTPIRRIRLQIAEKIIWQICPKLRPISLKLRNLNFSEIPGSFFSPRKMVATDERCASREAHPKAHDIPARNTGSQESYLWQRVERKPDYEHGQTTLQEREETSGRPPVGAAGRLDDILYTVSRSGWTFGRHSVNRQSERLNVWTISCIPSVATAGRLDNILYSAGRSEWTFGRHPVFRQSQRLDV